MPNHPVWKINGNAFKTVRSVTLTKIDKRELAPGPIEENGERGGQFTKLIWEGNKIREEGKDETNWGHKTEGRKYDNKMTLKGGRFIKLRKT